MPSMNTLHFVLVPYTAWGHIRPSCILATRLVREQENIVVTLIVASNVLDKTRAEVSRQFLHEPSESSKSLQRIRILSPCLTNLKSAQLFETIKLLADAYPAAYRTLYQAEPITCLATGTTFDAVPAPCAVILDSFCCPELHATRAVSGTSVPIIVFVASGAGAILRRYGPESMGGTGDMGPKIDAEVARTGLSADEIGPKIINHTEGKVVQIPGLPPMYDYEFYPQKHPFNPPVHDMVRGAYTAFRESDATIVTTSYSYESVSLDAMKQWFSDMQKELHVLGPLLPASYGTEVQITEEGASVHIEAFLGEMLLRHGKRSVFFISFGTLFWPTVSEYIEELIDALIEKQAPFILAYASPFANLSEEQAGKIKSSGLGMLTTWSPQQFILNHPATGWFLSHGGFNGITESLGSGIPLVCWPFTADQPVGATHLAEHLNVAFELFQVRTGQGVKPLYRNGFTPEGTREAVGIELRQTIDLCRSEKGQEMRSNAEKFKVKFAKAWEEGGSARQEMRRFLHKYT